MYISDFLKYCPNCQNKLNQKNNFFSCNNCYFYFYQNPIPTNGLIIYNDKKEILLVKRKFPPKKNYWDIAGGFINLKENLEESLFREVKEELNILIDKNKINYLTSINDIYFYKKIKHYTLCLIFTYKINGQKIKNIKSQDDVSQIKWFNKKNIPWNKIAFKGIKNALKLFFASF
ncbi:MAG: NUDIX domain-containing protein [Patescibacteria group bacterium]|nr:NUDIX domain-containing protein [Patescibacteria group bacterium]